MHTLPINCNYDDSDILKALIKAKYELRQLNALISAVPNSQNILNIITLLEAKESSAIESIRTSFDDLFKVLKLEIDIPNASDVLNYRTALIEGCRLVKEKGYISTNMIVSVHSLIEPSKGGIRKLPGTVIMNTRTNEILHIPPQAESKIVSYLNNLEQYINNSELHNIDPILKMAFVHYQFESIHPFYDGNGRSGRVLNVMYLILEKELCVPVLPLSKYINNTRSEYYKHLGKVRVDDIYIKDYLLYIIKGIEETAKNTFSIIRSFNSKIEEVSLKMKKECPHICSAKLVNYLFAEVCTTNEHFRNNFNISRNTATKYLNMLVDKGFLINEQVGKKKIYKNVHLYQLIDDFLQ